MRRSHALPRLYAPPRRSQTNRATNHSSAASAGVPSRSGPPLRSLRWHPTTPSPHTAHTCRRPTRPAWAGVVTEGGGCPTWRGASNIEWWQLRHGCCARYRPAPAVALRPLKTRTPHASASAPHTDELPEAIDRRLHKAFAQSARRATLLLRRGARCETAARRAQLVALEVRDWQPLPQVGEEPAP